MLIGKKLIGVSCFVHYKHELPLTGRRRSIANDVGGARSRVPPGLYTQDTFSTGQGYSGGAFASNHQPSGEGRAYISNHHSLNNRGDRIGRSEPRGSAGAYNSREPSLRHINGENSLVSFEDSIQNLVF